MQIEPFALERFFAQWEFNVRHLLCASDPEPMRLPELLALADDECRAWWDQLSLGYTETVGAPRLRAAIADLYDTITPEDLLVLVGAQEGIFLTVHALVRAGDEVLVMRPGYQSLHEVARSIGARVIDLPLAEDAAWQFPLDLLKRTVSRKTRLVIINTPHNPTGSLIPHEVYREIIDVCEHHGAYLLSDEVYRLLELDPADRLPPAADVYARAISLGVLSKPFGLAGLRLGWVASQDREALARISMLKDYTTICGTSPSEVLGTIALRAHDRLVERTMQIVRTNLALLEPFFERNRERISWTPPRAGTVAAARLPGDARPFVRALLDTHGVLLLPGDVLGLPPSHVRLGFGRCDLPDALPLLERQLQVPTSLTSPART